MRLLLRSPQYRRQAERSAVLRARAVVAVLLVFVSLAAAAVASAAGEHGASPLLADPRFLVAGERQAEAERVRRERRRSPEEGAERRRSRFAHRGASAAEALRVARSEFPEATLARPYRAFELPAGQRVVRLVGDSSALIGQEGSSQRGLLQSYAPVVARTESGARAPVDLALGERARGFAPANPVVPITIGGRADEPVRFERSGFGVRLLGATSSEGELVAGKAFFANVAADTDWMATPTLGGVELLAQLRSSESPERLSLSFAAPPGTELRSVAEPSGGVELVRDGRRLATVDPPVAMDAAGEPVPASYAVSGDRLDVEISHRDRDLMYPILLDPRVDESHDWRNSAQTTPPPWKFRLWSRPGLFGGDVGTTSDWGRGLRVYSKADQYYQATETGEWWLEAAPRDSYISWFSYAWLSHWPASTCVGMGIAKPDNATWEDVNTPCTAFKASSDTLCVRRASDPWNPCDLRYGTERNTARFQLWMSGAGTRTWQATTLMGQSYIVLSDRNNPNITQAPSDTGWVDGEATLSAPVSGSDAGLGMQYLHINGPGLSQSYRAHVDDDPSKPECTGRHSAYCPASSSHTFSYSTSTLPEGINTFSADAQDIIDRHDPSDPTWKVKVDRTPPAMALSGSLKDRENQELPPGHYELAARATDGDPAGTNAQRRSGVKRLRISVDGEPYVTDSQDCAQDSCPLESRFVFDTSEFDGGDHTVEVTAEDQLGHEATQSFRVRTACCLAPASTWGNVLGQSDVSFADVNGDGSADVVGRNRVTQELRVGLSTGSSFAPSMTWGTWSGPGSLSDLQAGDVDGDGQHDLIAHDSLDGGVYVSRSGGSSLGTPTRWGSWPSDANLRIADVDADDSADLVGRRTPTGEVLVALSDRSDEEQEGDFRFLDPTPWGTVPVTDEFLTADPTGEGAADSVTRNPTTGTITVGRSTALAFDPASEWGSLRSGDELVLGDFNNDRTSDVIGRERTTGTVTLAASTESGFAAPTSVGDFDSVSDVEAADVDGDGRDDLVGTNPLTGDIRVGRSTVTQPTGPEPEEWVADPEIVYDEGEDLITDVDDASEVTGVASATADTAATRRRLRLGWQDDRRLVNRAELSAAPFDGGAGEAAALAKLDQIYARIKEAGGTYVRFLVAWGANENADGTFYFDEPNNKLDKAIDLARSKGLQVYMTLTGTRDRGLECDTFYNASARTCIDDPNYDICGAPDHDERRLTGFLPDADCFARFVRATVAHFYPRVRDYGIWNEPNHRSWLRGRSRRDAPTDTYRSLYDAGYRAANGVTRNAARVFIGELSYRQRRGSTTTASSRDGIIDAHEFLIDVVGNRRLDTNGVAWHPYQLDRPPSWRGRPDEAGIGKIGTTQNRIDRLYRTKDGDGRSLMTTPDHKRPALLYTEFGYKNRSRRGSRDTHSDRRRGRLFYAALEQAWSGGLRVRRSARKPVHWLGLYTATEVAPGLPGSRDDFGIFAPDGTVGGCRSYGKGRNPQPRRAYCAGIYPWAAQHSLPVGNPPCPDSTPTC